MELYTLLMLLAQLARAKNAGQENDITKLLTLSAVAARGGATGRAALEEARAKVQQLVDEDRALTTEENEKLDASIEDKLARAAAVELPEG